jgi:hypothetical protein
MDFFHVRVPDSPGDFILLSPLPPEKELGDYTCNDGNIRWYFCKSCGVRCFAFWGQGEVTELDVEAWKGGDEKGEVREVWRAKREGWKEGMGGTGYLSVNAMTLDQGQEGLDLREWVEKKWVCYLDCKEEKEENRYDRPHDVGAY